jgi:hypothetical protein
VRTSKRKELTAKLVTALRPVAAAHLAHVSDKLLKRLKDAMAAAGARSAAAAAGGG